MNIQSTLGPNGLISKLLPGYEYRPQQVEAAAGIWKALKAKKHCFVEAGTGVGKSMAYLLPAIEYTAQAKKVVISTYTIYLQSQLMNKDIPFLQQLTPERKIKAVLMKGRGNYLCLSNFSAELGQLYLIADPNLSRLQKWAAETETGDVSELGFSFAGWPDISSDVDTCRRQECSYFTKCFYYKMRKAASDADIVVTNHSLFLSDLAIRNSDPNSGVLPHYDSVIFDEAHHLEAVATKVFGIEFDVRDVPDLMSRVRRTRDIAVDPKRLTTIEQVNDEIFSEFMGSPKQEFFFSDVQNQESASKVEGLASTLCTLLDGLNVELGRQDTSGRPELAERLDGLRRLSSRMRSDMMQLFFGPSEGFFRWGERSKSVRSPYCSLRYSPLSVADILKESLWDKIDSGILTSATLANSGSFGYVRKRLGVSNCSEVIEDSPFDFSTQCLLYIPRHLEFPSENPLYTDKVANEIEQLVLASKGRAFLLFTSYRMMNAVYDRLLGRLPFVMMKQGDMSNESLVQEFLKHGEACLFGVHSFWEGVDIRGEALSCVVIDKLPFAVPDSPVHRARVDAITADGGDWFVEYSMPQAQIRLKQGFGRLIRTTTDRGVVAILDSRLVKKMYGREFLRFLPQCPVTNKMDDVRTFFDPKP